MTGREYAELIASYILKNFGARGLVVYREVPMGKTIIGKNRHVDILVVHDESRTALAIECKYQDTLGTVDEKIPYAIEDMQAMGVPVCLAYAGSGFSQGILHLLAACPIAAQCAPSAELERSRETRELDIAIAMAFRFWDLVVAHKRPFELPRPADADPAHPLEDAEPAAAAPSPGGGPDPVPRPRAPRPRAPRPPAPRAPASAAPLTSAPPRPPAPSLVPPAPVPPAPPLAPGAAALPLAPAVPEPFTLDLPGFSRSK